MRRSNGLIERPEAGVLASYDWCVPAANNESYFVKSIANTDFMTGIWDPHIMRYSDDKECVTTVSRCESQGAHHEACHVFCDAVLALCYCARCLMYRLQRCACSSCQLCCAST